MEDYKTAKRLFGDSRPIYVRNIIRREIILKAKSRIGDAGDFDDPGDMTGFKEFLASKLKERVHEQLLADDDEE